jgi:hypothetical protein
METIYVGMDVHKDTIAVADPREVRNPQPPPLPPPRCPRRSLVRTACREWHQRKPQVGPQRQCNLLIFIPYKGSGPGVSNCCGGEGV